MNLFSIPHVNIYLTLLGLLIIAFIFFLTTRSASPKTITKTPAKKTVLKSQDIKAIAGDDVMTTQLDLARAYIEMGKKQLAKKILAHVAQNGTSSQQQEAYELIALLEPA
jgi:FimV-like protein